MGTRIPTPIVETGTDCSHCTPPTGNLWESGKSPASVYIYFTGLIPCSPYPYLMPNHHVFKLAQSAFEPCRWESDGSVWSVRFWAYNIFSGNSRITLVDPALRYVFYSEIDACPEEYSIYGNSLVDCGALRSGYGGSAIVSWMELPLELLDAIGMSTAATLFHEPALHPDGDIIHKFCNLRDATNIKLKYSPP